MFNKSIDTTTTLYLTVFHPPLYSPYTRIRVYTYVSHSRPTDFHSSTRLNSGPHSAELVQSTKTTTDPSRIFFSCSTHHLTSPPPSPHHYYYHCHHHCHSHDAFSGCSIPYRLQSHYSTSHPVARAFLSISISLSPALSPAHTLRSYTSGDIYLLLTRNP